MGGVAGAIGIRVVRRRRHLYLTIGVVAVAGVLASITVGLMQGWSTDHHRGQRACSAC